MKTVSVAGSVTSVGDCAFNELPVLESAEVGTLGSNMFLNYKTLSQVMLDSSVTEIPSSAFGGCTALKSTLASGKKITVTVKVQKTKKAGTAKITVKSGSKKYVVKVTVK